MTEGSRVDEAEEPPIISCSLQDRKPGEPWLIVELVVPEFLPKIVSMSTSIVG